MCECAHPRYGTVVSTSTTRLIFHRDMDMVHRPRHPADPFAISTRFRDLSVREHTSYVYYTTKGVLKIIKMQRKRSSEKIVFIKSLRKITFAKYYYKNIWTDLIYTIVRNSYLMFIINCLYKK